ncbi:MAG: adenylate/guanylate cyclase domain-containing protein [Candidatus Binatia bacterium]
MKKPPIRYAKAGDAHIAYQVVGDAAVDTVFLPEVFAPLDGMWEHPGHLRFWRYHTSFCRMIARDPRGFGASDPAPLERIGDLDEWAEDVRAVMDAVGVERAVILGEGYGVQVAIRFSLSFPDRVRALALMNGYARMARDADQPWGVPQAENEALLARIESSWGTGRLVERGARSLRDPAFSDWRGRYERLYASPKTAAALIRKIFNSDVRHLLARVTHPTLVMHTGDLVWGGVEHSRYLAEHIPHARLLTLPVAESFYLIEPGPGSEWETFITGGRPRAVHERELTTVLFTDIVGSTQKVVQLGDERWRDVLEDVDACVREILARHSGRLVKQTGDGHLATFTRPSSAVEAAVALRAGLRVFGVDIRAGLHTGEVELRADGDVGGLGVHVASRITSLGGAGEILVSRTVADLAAGASIRFVDRGTHELKGLQGAWQLYEVER